MTGRDRALLRDLVVRARLVGTFECPACLLELPAGEFRQLRGRRDSWCKACRADDVRRYRAQKKREAAA